MANLRSSCMDYISVFKDSIAIPLLSAFITYLLCSLVCSLALYFFNNLRYGIADLCALFYQKSARVLTDSEICSKRVLKYFYGYIDF
jgi:hypothetical protein